MRTFYINSIIKKLFVKLLGRASHRDSNIFISRPDAFSNFLPLALTDTKLKEVIDSKDEFIRAVISGRVKLSDFGNVFKALVQGRDFIDLCCGDPLISTYPRFFAQAFGARQYKGVDLNYVSNEVVKGEYSEFPEFESEYHNMDLLDFLKAEVSQKNGTVIYLSGIEPLNQSRAENYIKSCEVEIVRLIKNGGAVIIAQGTYGFDFAKHNLKLMTEKPHHKVYSHK